MVQHTRIYTMEGEEEAMKAYWSQDMVWCDNRVDDWKFPRLNRFYDWIIKIVKELKR